MFHKEITTLYSENNTIPINIICGQNAELVNVKTCGTHRYHCAVKSEMEYLYVHMSLLYLIGKITFITGL
jgi:hypothetical protein